MFYLWDSFKILLLYVVDDISFMYEYQIFKNPVSFYLKKYIYVLLKIFGCAVRTVEMHSFQIWNEHWYKHHHNIIKHLKKK